MDTEEWRPIIRAGERTDYEISSLGRARRVSTTRRFPAGHVHRASPNPAGYLKIYMHFGRGRHPAVGYIHQLVAHAFIGEQPKGLFVNHKDGVKTNNVPANLEYVTPRQNIIHAASIGLMPIGERNVQTKLTAEQARIIKAGLREGRTFRSLGEEFGVCPASIRNIYQGKSFRYVEV